MVRLVSFQPALNSDFGTDTYVCISCNLADEAKKSWLLQRVIDPPPSDSPHHALHTLALAVDSSVTHESELTTEDRLNRLEKKFEEQAAASRELHIQFEKMMQERMEEMSRLMHQVLAARVPPYASGFGY